MKTLKHSQELEDFLKSLGMNFTVLFGEKFLEIDINISDDGLFELGREFQRYIK